MQVEHEIPPVGGDGPVPDLTSDDESEETPDLPPVETLDSADAD